METRFCVECNEFLDEKRFPSKSYSSKQSSRSICKVHANKMAKESRLKKWAQDPLVRKAHEVWQIAYADSSRTFKVSCGISQGSVLALLQRHQLASDDDLRLVPVDPTKPLSIDNYCFTSTQNKTDMSRIWRKLKCVRDYMRFMGPDMKRPILGSSTDIAI